MCHYERPTLGFILVRHCVTLAIMWIPYFIRRKQVCSRVRVKVVGKLKGRSREANLSCSDLCVIMSNECVILSEAKNLTLSEGALSQRESDTPKALKLKQV